METQEMLLQLRSEAEKLVDYMRTTPGWSSSLGPTLIGMLKTVNSLSGKLLEHDDSGEAPAQKEPEIDPEIAVVLSALEHYKNPGELNTYLFRVLRLMASKLHQLEKKQKE